MKKNASHKKSLAMICLGDEANSIYYDLRERGIVPEIYVDNYKEGLFWGHRIKRLEDIKNNLKDVLFLICSDNNYEEIKKQLEQFELEEFQDFIKAGAYGRKIVYMNANCYGIVLKEMLMSSDSFCQQYYIYESQPLYLVGEDYSLDGILANCDVYIHQNLRPDNAFGYRFSGEYARKYLGRNCQEITFPNLYGMGRIYFTRGYKNNERSKESETKTGLFPLGDELIDSYVEKGATADEIASIVSSGRLLDYKEIIDTTERVFEEYKAREAHWDIKTVDYIRVHYKERQLFWDLVHPTNEIMERIAIEILHLLGIETNNVSSRSSMDSYEMPIFPEVYDALELLFFNGGPYRENSQMKLKKMSTIEDYVKQYVAWCFDRKSEDNLS